MIKDNIARIKATLPEGVRLVAVSKTKPVADIEEAYRAGQRIFGENYAAELRDKHPQLPADIEWHFIGHLQAKQLKYYIGFVSMIHGVDSVEHLQAVEQAAAKVGRVVDVLLQVHVAQEETKFGFTPEELLSLDGSLWKPLEHVRVCGLMGMASHTDDVERVRADFRAIKELFNHLKASAFKEESAFCELSMGMSGDYQLAIEEGSTIVRIGSSIFGARQYAN
ncbi:MAG: YggS family pyridoxal phosphate-dependent enzyme [Bacteroidales bacterium]|nr:YggS family pyridoxal phosphate-dependent enzyme [Bacteroidales bacterium]